MENSAIYYDLYGPLVSLLNRYTQQNNQITYTTMCIQCIHLHSLGSFYLHLPHLYSDVILYWLKTTEGFRQKSAYPLELIQAFNFRSSIQTKMLFDQEFNFDSYLWSKLFRGPRHQIRRTTFAFHNCQVNLQPLFYSDKRFEKS